MGPPAPIEDAGWATGFKLVATRAEGRLRMVVSRDGAPVPDARYAFYVYSGSVRTAVRWYEDSPRHEEDDDPARPATKVVAFVRDAAGHQARLAAQVVKGSRSPPRIFVYGSCVSRDAFHFAGEGVELAGYIARSSLASAFDAHRLPDGVADGVGRIESAFQRRVVRWDLERHAGHLLHDARCDAVLLDLIDERFSLLEVDGALLTVSPEFVRSGYPIDGARLIRPGSPPHMEAWNRGLIAFLAAVGDTPVIVNRVHWASVDEQGEPLPDQERIARNNAVLDRMYARLARQPRMRFIDYPEHLLVADPQHKWGVSPFHFVRGMYDHTMAELARLLLHRRGAASAPSHHPREAE